MNTRKDEKMKKSKYFGGFGILVAALFASSSYATSFLTVYKQALHNDPAFAEAQATWESQKMNLPIARANYLPQFSITGNGSRNYTYNNPETLSTINDYNWAYGYSLTLTQAIFDLSVWNAIKSADAVTKAATASYLAAQQSLMQRTAQAYFDVLKAYETLNFTIANKKAVWQQYTTSEKKFHAGLIAIMDVYDAKSRYDQVTAQEISARNNLSNKIEALHAITGHYYKNLNGLGEQIKLVKPIPLDIDAWTQVATKQNYNLIAQRYNVLAALHQISQQSAGDIPSVDFSSGFTEAQNFDNQTNHTVTDQATIGLNLTYQPLQGGLVYASTKQARYNYVAASAKLGTVYRQVVNQTHNNFTGVLSSLLRVQADKLRIASANKALIATEAGLKVGARTMVDVLNDLTTLYLAQQQYVDDQYTYLTNYVDLKVAAGTLKESDMVILNHWMSRQVPLHKYITPWASYSLKNMSMKYESTVDDESQDKNINYRDESVNPDIAIPADEKNKNKENKTSDEAQSKETVKTDQNDKTDNADKTDKADKTDSSAISNMKHELVNPVTDQDKKRINLPVPLDLSHNDKKAVSNVIHHWWF